MRGVGLLRGLDAGLQPGGSRQEAVGRKGISGQLSVAIYQLTFGVRSGFVSNDN